MDLVADLQLFEQQLAALRRRVQQMAAKPAPAGQLPGWPDTQQQQLLQHAKSPAAPSTDAYWTQLLLPDPAAPAGSNKGLKQCAGQLAAPASQPKKRPQKTQDTTAARSRRIWR
jgi:hypothetical protein